MEKFLKNFFSKNKIKERTAPPEEKSEEEHYRELSAKYETGLTKEAAKAELARQIEEKLANLSVSNLEELLDYEWTLEREQEKERERERIARRRERRNKRKAMEARLKQEGEVGPGEEESPSAIAGQIYLVDIGEPGDMIPRTIAQKKEKQEKKAKKKHAWKEPFLEAKKNPPGEDADNKEKILWRLTVICWDVILKIRILLKLLHIKMIGYYEANPEKDKNIRQRLRRVKSRFLHVKRRFLRRQKKNAHKMVAFIERLDYRNDRLARKGAVAVVKGGRHFNFAREWADVNKRRLLKHLALGLLAAILVVAVLSQLTGYEYSYDGKVLGYVKKQEDVLKLVSLVSDQLTKKYGAEISISQETNIALRRTLVVNREIDTIEDVLNRLTYMQDMNARAYGIYSEGTRLAIVDTAATAEEVLREVKAAFLTPREGVTYEKSTFVEQVEAKPVETKLGRIMPRELAVERILTGAMAKEVYVVAKGDTFSGVANKVGLSQEQLLNQNTGVNPEKLYIGQELVLTQSMPLVTVQTVEVTHLLEYIPHNTIYENTDSLYIGESKTKVKGYDGERNLMAKIVRNNGEEVARLELSSSIVKEPLSSVVYVGTKKVPPKIGTGVFKYPVSGARLTSKFGPRGSRFHYGIDLACATGTRISASDGGTVIFAGYSGSYGYVVKIDHGGGFVTVYAHCSKLHVSKGDKVFQGQQIANVGNTGRSTGPHCHFEVQKHGTAVNPLNYL